jgi:DNA-binding response OmpR family regulator
MKILLLEDDAETAGALCDGLRERGFEATHVTSCPEAIARVEVERFDAAILDLMVPGGSGYDVLLALRRSDAHAPVLILTARDAVDDRVEGLERGADDYLMKPFAFAELVARLRALLRRPARRLEPLHAGAIEVDALRRRATLHGRRLDLTESEFSLLRCLAERKGEILTRRHILDLAWGYRFDPGTNVVDVHVNRLRRKLEPDGAGLLRTVRGIGYVLD